MLNLHGDLALKRPMTPRHFLDIDDYDIDALRLILDCAKSLKKTFKTPAAIRPKLAEGAVLAMLFEKTSTRTRVSFDVAMRQLGGETIVLNHSDMQLGRGETIADTARVLSRYVDAIMMRSTSHETLLELARYATVPVINGLSDRSHPCQILADVMTLEEKKGPVEPLVVAWVGDGNNVAASWIHAAVRFGFTLHVAPPKALQPPQSLIDWAHAEGGKLVMFEDPARRWRAPTASSPTSGCRWGRRTRPNASTFCVPIRSTRRSWLSRQRRDLHALPAGASRQGSDGRRDRRAAIGGVRRGREPAACAAGHPGVVP